MTKIKLLSPITCSPNVIIERTIDCQTIINKYDQIKPIGIDVRRFFHGLKEIQIYKCLDSGYRFYYPFNIMGDSLLYEQLEHLPKYYNDWRWEHSIASNYIENGSRVLEIGCGNGNFLKKLREKGCIPEGLEINSSVIKNNTENKISIYPYSIDELAIKKPSYYDIVCSFQVLEHVCDVQNFIKSSIDTLKSGGLMIIGVPNNDSPLYEFDFDMTLNLPPHHMGLWNTNSLISLQKYFDIRIEKIHIEPFRESDLNIVIQMVTKIYKNKTLKKFGWFHKIINLVVGKPINFGTLSIAKYLAGHSIVAVFRKN